MDRPFSSKYCDLYYSGPYYVLKGIVLGLRFYLIGILLFITAGLKIKNQLILLILKRESDFTKTNPEFTGKERRNT